MTTQSEKKNLIFSGTVISDRMAKTVTVKVERSVMHPLYRRRYVVSKKFHVHDPQQKFHVGDKVSFRPCRPLSRTKRWIVLYDKG